MRIFSLLSLALATHSPPIQIRIQPTELIVQSVNGAATPRDAELDFGDLPMNSLARGIELKGKSFSEENSFLVPENLRPREIRLRDVDPRTKIRFAPYSVTILRFRKR